MFPDPYYRELDQNPSSTPSSVAGYEEDGDQKPAISPETRGALSVVGWMIGTAFWVGVGYWWGKSSKK